MHGIPKIQNKELVKNADLKSDLREKAGDKKGVQKESRYNLELSLIVMSISPVELSMVVMSISPSYHWL